MKWIATAVALAAIACTTPGFAKSNVHNHRAYPANAYNSVSDPGVSAERATALRECAAVAAKGFGPTRDNPRYYKWLACMNAHSQLQ